MLIQVQKIVVGFFFKKFVCFGAICPEPSLQNVENGI